MQELKVGAEAIDVAKSQDGSVLDSDVFDMWGDKDEENKK
ncbi:hypothetical protein A2U01_0009412, partial [Trifolium medium]|nr:hypothetical protein [Trifolium medium]